MIFLLMNNSDLISKSFFDELKVTRITANFNGSAYNGSSILVYGDGGIILKSTTGGSKWEQINLNDSFNIIDMVNIGSKYYGIYNKKYMFFSTDNANSWQFKDFGDIRFHKMLVNENNLCVILDRKIWKLNQNLNILKEYKLTLDSVITDGVITDNKLFFSSDKGKISFINLENEVRGDIDLSSFGICSDCPTPLLMHSNITNLIFFLIENLIYQYDVKLNEVKYLYKPLKIINAPITTQGDDFFQIYNINYPNLKIDSIFFIKVDKISNKLQHQKNPGNDRYIYNLKFNSVKFLSKDTIIAVGKGKLIYMSFDKGTNWVLKSSMSETLTPYIFDRINLRNISKSLIKFDFSNDGGATWLSQNQYSKLFVQEPNFLNPDLSIFKDKKFGLYLANPLLMESDKNAILTADGGNSIVMKDLRKIISYGSNYRSLCTDFMGKYIIVTHREINNITYTIFDIINENFELEKNTYQENLGLYFINYINDTLFAIGKYTKDYPKNRLSLFYSTDGASNWIEDFSFEYDTNFITFYNLSPIYNQRKNKIFLYMTYTNDNYESQYYKIYMIDINKKFCKEI